jgi:hypothetical protein
MAGGALSAVSGWAWRRRGGVGAVVKWGVTNHLFLIRRLL